MAGEINKRYTGYKEYTGYKGGHNVLIAIWPTGDLPVRKSGFVLVFRSSNLELVMREWHWWTWYQFGRVLKLSFSMGGYCWYRRTYYSLAQVLYLVQVGAGYAHNMRLQAVSCHPHSAFPLSPRPLQPCYPFQIAPSLSFITRGALISFFWLKPFCGCCSMVELF